MGWNTVLITSHLRISERTVLRYWEAYKKYVDMATFAVNFSRV
jgi:hypothetical protein